MGHLRRRLVPQRPHRRTKLTHDHRFRLRISKMRPTAIVFGAKSLTPAPEHGTLIKFGAAASVSLIRDGRLEPMDSSVRFSLTGLNHRALHAPHAAQSMKEAVSAPLERTLEVLAMYA